MNQEVDENNDHPDHPTPKSSNKTSFSPKVNLTINISPFEASNTSSLGIDGASNPPLIEVPPPCRQLSFQQPQSPNNSNTTATNNNQEVNISQNETETEVVDNCRILSDSDESDIDPYNPCNTNEDESSIEEDNYSAIPVDSENNNCDLEEWNGDDLPEQETVEIEISSLKVIELKRYLRMKGASVVGNKALLIDRLTSLNNGTTIHLDGEEARLYLQQKSDRENAAVSTQTIRAERAAANAAAAQAEREGNAHWELLKGTDAPIPDGISECMGATEGFVAPTNRDADPITIKKIEFLTDIERPSLEFRNGRRGMRRSRNPSMRGGPSSNLNLPYDASPIDFFNSFISSKFREKVMKDFANMRAVIEGAGVEGNKYSDFIPFSLCEIDAFIGLLILNGLNPKPRMELWFSDSIVFGNRHIRKRFKNGSRRYKHFRRFLCLYDPRIHPMMPITRRPMFKVEKILQELENNSKNKWDSGRVVSIDEQTIGFQGHHQNKLRITYKRIGDGFQCDALCDRGYTIAFRFRHDTNPSTGYNNICPLHQRVVYLVQQLNTNWNIIVMDNLYNSRGLAEVLWKEKMMCHGVVRTHNRGLPKDIIQKEGKTKRDRRNLRGTLKAALLKGDDTTPKILSCSIYDTKPVHIITSANTDIKWVVKSKKIWDKSQKQSRDVRFMRLNLIDDYNLGMGGVDMADQLRLQYRIERWMRQRKWWWAIFLWTIGVAHTNAYVCYTTLYDNHVQAKKKVSHKKLTHIEFLERLAKQLIWPETNHHRNDEDGESAIDASICSISTISVMNEITKIKTRQQTSRKRTQHDESYKQILNQRCTTINKNSLIEKFDDRFDGKFHPSIEAKPRRPCQYCQYLQKQNDDSVGRIIQNKKRKRTSGNKLIKPIKRATRNCNNVRRCLICNVELCPDCFNEFHGIEYDAYA